VPNVVPLAESVEQFTDHQPELLRWLCRDGEDDRVLVEAQIENGMALAGTSATKGEVGVALSRGTVDADLLGQAPQAGQEQWGISLECGPDGNVPCSVHSKSVCRRK
jgi:hypothetical protein